MCRGQACNNVRADRPLNSQGDRQWGRGRPSRQIVYARLESGVAELNSRLGGLPSPDESQFIWSDIWHLEAHHSTALEGNTLVLREVEALLEKGRAVGAKELKEYMEVIGYGQAAHWVYGQAIRAGRLARRQSDQHARGSHHSLRCDDTGVGNSHRIRTQPCASLLATAASTTSSPSTGGMTPPPCPQVAHRMADWVQTSTPLRSLQARQTARLAGSAWRPSTTSSNASTPSSMATAAPGASS